ncbi:anaphase-promoting complex, cyclosome, subunit 4-domain-containing protein [Tirmania nivea]|nr:anaphase-promoting complex, cyclosome, subunit 4-domain-containing protein [Tirmania nivea]
MEDKAAESIISVKPPQGFQIQFEKTLPNPARPGLAAWSPKHDLLCFVTTNESVLLYRMNGQRVWGIAQRKEKAGQEGQVERLQWRPDGKVIALGYSDGTTKICDVNNGKVVLTVAPEAPGFGSVSCVGWVDNRLAPNNEQKQEGIKALTAGIPKGILDLEVNQMLPRLSVLPGTGPDSLFSSKITLDAMINTVKGADSDILDVLLVGDDNGRILVNIFESFAVGQLHLSTLCPQLGAQCKLLSHTAPPSLKTHALLISTPNSFYFTTLDLLFTSQFGQYLHQLAFTSTKLQALLKYIKETVTALNSEWKTMNDLHTRYVSLVNEALQDAGGSSGGVGLEFFELLITGVGSEGLKEWLVDVLTERGQKRWEKTSLNGYETLRRLVHENLLPTCERLIILLSRLRGLARWKERGSPLGLEPEDFTRCVDAVAGLTVYAHSFVSKLNHELDLYRAFSLWLKNVLDEMSSVININDTPPEDPQVDTLKVAEYVGNHLLSSTLAPFFAKSERPQSKKLFEDGESIFKFFCSYDIYNKGGSCSWGDLAEHLMGLCQGVFEKPATAMRRSLRIARPVLLHKNGEVEHVQIHMVDLANNPIAYVALYSRKGAADSFVLAKCDFNVEGGLSTIAKIQCVKVRLSSIYKTSDEDDASNIISLLDLKFVDNESIILLIENETTQTTHMVTTPYGILPFSDSRPYPIPTRRDSSSTVREDVSSIFDFARSEDIPYVDIEPIKGRVFEWSTGFFPERVVVNGKPDRRIGALVDREGLRYVVFDLDMDEVQEDAVEEETEGEGEEEEEEEGEVGDEEEGEEVDDEPMDESDMDMSMSN